MPRLTAGQKFHIKMLQIQFKRETDFEWFEDSAVYADWLERREAMRIKPIKKITEPPQPTGVLTLPVTFNTDTGIPELKNKKYKPIRMTNKPSIFKRISKFFTAPDLQI